VPNAGISKEKLKGTAISALFIFMFNLILSFYFGLLGIYTMTNGEKINMDHKILKKSNIFDVNCKKWIDPKEKNTHLDVFWRILIVWIVRIWVWRVIGIRISIAIARS
jgi:hypothetical protein